MTAWGQFQKETGTRFQLVPYRGLAQMRQADFERLHKYLRETPYIHHISDEMRAVIESEWPELVPKLPPKQPQRGRR